MTSPELHVVVPGPLEQRTGGYLYDARMVAGLRRLGWRVGVLNLEGAFPDGDELAHAALSAALESLPECARVLIDGLAIGGLPGPVRAHAGRLRILSLVHHPLADETGLSPERRLHFAESEAIVLAACTGVLVTSEYTAQRLEGAYGVASERVRVVPPGTDPAEAASGPAEGEPPRLLCVGTVTPRKGHDVLVAALAQLKDLEWTCVCAGSLDRDPSYVAAVFEQVGRVGLGDRIEFVGERDANALEELYHASSIFVLASHYEGYGMALAEALARGLPVVSTTGGAIPHTVPEDAGLLIEPGDDRALAEALGSLLAGPVGGTAEALAGGAKNRDALASAARRRASELPNWDESVQAFATAVLELAPAVAPSDARSDGANARSTRTES